MKIGLYFGSFNPIHIGHVAIANYIAEFSDLQEIWFVISPQNPLKNKESLLDNYQRYYMVNLAIEPYTNMRASTIEFNLPQPSYTIHTLIHLQEKYPQHTFSLIMGGDNLENFDKWKNYEEILAHYHIYVYSRPHTNIPQQFENHPSITYLQAPLMEISSSFIRNCIHNKKNVRAYMPESAWKYLDEMNFYKK